MYDGDVGWMKTRLLTRFSVVSSGLVSRRSPVWGLSSLVEQESRGVAWLYRLGSVAEVRSPSQKQSATCVSTQKIRWSGRAWDAQRGDSSRYIFRFRKIQSQMAVGHRLDSFHAAWSCEGGGRILLLGVAFHRCLPKRHPHLPSAPSAPLQVEDDPGTRDSRPPFLCEIAPGARRLPCHLAHMEKAAMSRPQRHQIPVVYAGQLVTSQPPIHDNS
ncbi:hypothetical protein EJ07DRAFT_151454 [Lizonia empirigonia]|nr:hypothetical protein EJ07DRAFT_151454 [Lizonia empirigonia]